MEKGVPVGTSHSAVGGSDRQEPWVEPFRRALALHGRPEARVKWNILWARRFAASLRSCKLPQASREDAEAFLVKVASWSGVAPWQVDQAADSLTILLGNVFGQPWARGRSALPHRLRLRRSRSPSVTTPSTACATRCAAAAIPPAPRSPMSPG